MSETLPLTAAEFQDRFEAMLRALPEGIVRDHAVVAVPCDRPPWLDSGLDLAAGERVTAFTVGRTQLSGTDIWIGPDFQLWYRIGPVGEIFRGTRDTHTFAADQPGRLYLASYFPGEWATRTGGLGTPEEVYQQVTGNLSVGLIRWLVDPAEGLAQLAASGDIGRLVAGEIDRLAAPVQQPEGWEYLWFLGPAEIFMPCGPPRETAICCHTHRDVGILHRAVSLPLAPDTRLRWSWKVDVLPSAVREDSFPTHDYLSIAVEFDNGQDITYYWSAELPVGTVYRCPIPSWHARETHVVIRSGTEGLGEWLDEERNLYEDYVRAIGGPVPARIVRAWLIAVSVFQRGEGRCAYGDIAFLAGGERIPVR
jgi:hypothetical protein